MKNSANYKVLDRKKFAVIMIILMSIVAVAVWVGLDRLAEYGDELKELAATEPLEAAATITRLLRTIAILNGVVLSSFALLIIWHGWRGCRSEAMPPKGSWILEGQRSWTGESAVRIAKFKIAVGILLGVLGVIGSIILWNLGDKVVDQTSKHAGPPVYELHQVTRHGLNHRSRRVASVRLI